MTVAASVTLRDLPLSHVRSRVSVSATAWAGACAWILLAPFEGSRPLVHLPGQSLSSVEAALLAVFVTLAAVTLWARELPTWRTPLTGPWVVFVLAMLLAALVAPADHINAVHMAGRFGLAFGVYLVTVNGVTSSGRLKGILVVAAVAGVVVAAIALLEFFGVAPVLDALRTFRPGVAVVGGQVRAGGPFLYPTIASMYLEILFALVLVLVPLSIDAGRPVHAAAAASALALMAQAVILTFTRAGLLTMASSLAIVGASRFRQRGFDRGARALAGVAVVVAIELLASHPVEATRLRLTSDTQEGWYRARIAAPADLVFPTGSTMTVPVTVTNAGRTTWDAGDSPPCKLAYHWLLADEDRVVIFDGLRTSFAVPVPPGATVSVPARVQAPGKPGQYRLMWDVVQEHRQWFSTEPGAEPIMSRVVVRGPMTGPLGSMPTVALPGVAVRPSRFVLWRAGVRMLAAHPIFGVGPDNFRLLYGGYAGIVAADARTHTNDMYLEMAVGGGLVGGLAFAWLCWRALAQFVGAFGRGSGAATAGAGVAAAGMAIALHGLVDSFLGFTATYVLFAITLGLAVACCNGLATSHANRV